MTADLADWQDESALDHRRRIRTAFFISLAIHGLFFALFAVKPPRPLAPMPSYLAVDLVAAPPASGPAPPRSAPKPAPPAEPTPPPPAAEPAPPPPPIAKAPVQVLPEETPGRIRKAKPEPKIEKPKATPPPEAKPKPRRRRTREKELSYEDAMAALDDELGVDETADLLSPASEDPPQSSGEPDRAGGARNGVRVSPEQAAWDRAVTARIRERFPNFARYRGRGLATTIEIEVSASGQLSGEPRLVGTSGDLDFDRMVLAVVSRAAPLPLPPEPGTRRLSLTSDER